MIFRGKANDGLVYDYESDYNSIKWLPEGTTIADLALYVHEYDSIEKLKKQARDSFDGFMDNFDLQTGEIYYTPFDD